MSELSVRDLLSGSVPAGSEVTLKGWVRTRRDSKQGFSFINLHDGSCFDAIQVVADKSVPGYENEVLHLTGENGFPYLGLGAKAFGDLSAQHDRLQQQHDHPEESRSSHYVRPVRVILPQTD